VVEHFRDEMGLRVEGDPSGVASMSRTPFRSKNAVFGTSKRKRMPSASR